MIRRTVKCFASRLLLGGVIATVFAFAAGCNMVKGAGKDITALGESGEDLISKD